MASSKKPRPAELIPPLLTFLKQAVQPGQTLLLGLSGGLDSCVLLDLLQRLQPQLGFHLQALHVNHGISPNAPDWERFCAELCLSRQIPFRSVCVEVPRASGLGLEAAAREARYAALLAQPADAIVLAHHRDDQAETLLLQLLRGAGVKGLAGMGEVSIPRSAVGGPLKSILRPLLDISRVELQAYAEAQRLQWIEDESNLDLAYDRNFLRHHVFPELEKRFPAARTTLARSAAHLAEAASLLDEVAQQDAAGLLHQGRLDVAGLAQLSAARGKNLLRYWLATFMAAAPNTRRLREIYRQLLEARADASIRIAVEGGQVHRYRGEAWFAPEITGAGCDALQWRGEPELKLPGGRLVFAPSNGSGLSLQKVHAGVLQVRGRSGGERFRPDARRPTRTLRHLFQENGVPPWQRESLPLLYLDGELAVVPGIGVASELQARAGEAGLEVTWQPA